MNQAAGQQNWFEVGDVAHLPSPSLLIYRDRVENNIRRMLALSGGPDRVRPHIKTHKMREPIVLQRGLGITKFKCATVAEAELAARAGVCDLLVAYQPVGPAVRRLAELIHRFPQVRFSVTADDGAAIRDLSGAMALFHRGSSRGNNQPDLEVLVDLDVGQHRTGVPPGPQAIELYRLIASLSGLKPGGLHAYDGHLSESDPVQREQACESAFAPVAALRSELEALGLPVPRVVAGGSPTFPFHAKRGNVESSPGTFVLWDAGYLSKFRDLDFLPAALLLTRVVSKPGPKRLCLDLGHKALASEMPHPRVKFLNLVDAQTLLHSEEHLVVETDQSEKFQVGDCLYGMPWHICPTVALHSEAAIVERGRIVGAWKVVARERRLTI